MHNRSLTSPQLQAKARAQAVTFFLPFLPLNTPTVRTESSEVSTRGSSIDPFHVLFLPFCYSISYQTFWKCPSEPPQNTTTTTTAAAATTSTTLLVLVFVGQAVEQEFSKIKVLTESWACLLNDPAL